MVGKYDVSINPINRRITPDLDQRNRQNSLFFVTVEGMIIGNIVFVKNLLRTLIGSEQFIFSMITRNFISGGNTDDFRG